MSEKPRRVQLSRKKGWKMPVNTVKVTRPGRWGNPFKVEGERTAATAVEAYRERMGHILSGPLGDSEAHALRHYLAGKNLACWCSLDQPCHADVLLELANGDPA